MRKHAKTSKNMGHHRTTWDTLDNRFRIFKVLQVVLVIHEQRKQRKHFTSFTSLNPRHPLLQGSLKELGAVPGGSDDLPAPVARCVSVLFPIKAPKLFKHLQTPCDPNHPLYQLYPIIPCAFLSCSGPCFLPQTIQSRPCRKPSA